jgi:hypothetical protein
VSFQPSEISPRSEPHGPERRRRGCGKAREGFRDPPSVGAMGVLGG